jgi:hypothetical protein
MPLPVLDGAMTGVLFWSATGWAPTAVLERVGPMMPTTFPCWMSVWNCCAPWVLSDWSSTIVRPSLAPLRPPWLISSSASRIAFFCCGP